MNAIVFAAGIGSRLKPFTDFHPKALAPLGGKPVLRHVLENLARAGVTHTVVNIHHFAPQVADFLAQNPIEGMTVETSDESTLLLDTAGALAKIVRENHTISALPPDAPILIHNADIFTDLDLAAMVRQHKATVADATLLADPRRESSRKFLWRADGSLAGWLNKRTGHVKPEGLATEGLAEGAFGGIHVLSRRILDDISAQTGPVLRPWSITDYYISACKRVDIRCYTAPAATLWHDIGTPAKLAAAEEALANLAPSNVK